MESYDKEFAIKRCVELALASVLVYLVIVHLRTRDMVRKASTLASLTLHRMCLFCHFLGHLTPFLQRRINMGDSIPAACLVYDIMHFEGIFHILRRSNMFLLWQAHIPFIVASTADGVETILTNNIELEKAWMYEFTHPWIGTGLLTSFGDKWKTRRRMLTPAFHFGILKDFVCVFNKQARVLCDVIDQHTDKECVDIAPIITRCSLDIICESILGKEVHAQTKPAIPYVKKIGSVSEDIFERTMCPWLWNDLIFKLSHFGRTFLTDVRKLHNFTKQFIAEKQEKRIRELASKDAMHNSKDDSELSSSKKKKALLDLLIDEKLKNNTLTDENIREEVDTFTFEGHDTTSVSMSWTLYLIGLHPWVQERIHEELDAIFQGSDRDPNMDDLQAMKYLECVIKESLRLYPPVPFYGRQLRNDVQYRGHAIPSGSTAVVAPLFLHRDPEVFPNPEKFDPDRFSGENSHGRSPFAYVPFSAGPRNCIGQRFALLEEKAVLSRLLRVFQVRSLDPRDKIFLLPGLVLRSQNGIRLQVRRRGQKFDFQHVYYTQ